MESPEPWPEGASPLIAKALSYWRGKRGDRAVPARRDIDPIEIPGLLPHVMLVDVEGDPPRLRYRLIGTAIVAFRDGIVPRDATGHYVDETTHQYGTQLVVAQFLECVATREPVFRSGEFAPDATHTGTWQRLALPLSGDGSRIDMLLVVFVRL